MYKMKLYRLKGSEIVYENIQAETIEELNNIFQDKKMNNNLAIYGTYHVSNISEE